MNKIDKNSWHYKWYVIASQLNAKWQGKDHYLDYPLNKQTGLCPYMRMILMWGPLAILSNLVPIGAVVAVFLYLPASAMGWMGIVWLLFYIFTVFACIGSIGLLVNWRARYKEKNKKSNLEKQHPDYEAPETGRTLLVKYATTFHTKICPMLEMPKND